MKIRKPRVIFFGTISRKEYKFKKSWRLWVLARIHSAIFHSVTVAKFLRGETTLYFGDGGWAKTKNPFQEQANHAAGSVSGRAAWLFAVEAACDLGLQSFHFGGVVRIDHPLRQSGQFVAGKLASTGQFKRKLKDAPLLLTRQVFNLFDHARCCHARNIAGSEIAGKLKFIRAYPIETVIAEKLEARVTLGMANSRMKDYFDLWHLANKQSEWEGETSVEA